jgi:hypothetical protein
MPVTCFRRPALSLEPSENVGFAISGVAADLEEGRAFPLRSPISESARRDAEHLSNSIPFQQFIHVGLPPIRVRQNHITDSGLTPLSGVISL